MYFERIINTQIKLHIVFILYETYIFCNKVTINPNHTPTSSIVTLAKEMHRVYLMSPSRVRTDTYKSRKTVLKSRIHDNHVHMIVNLECRTRYT